MKIPLNTASLILNVPSYLNLALQQLKPIPAAFCKCHAPLSALTCCCCLSQHLQQSAIAPQHHTVTYLQGVMTAYREQALINS